MYSQNCWVSGLCPSPGILNDYKSQCFENCICFRLQVRGRRPNRVRVSLLSAEDGNRSRFETLCFLIVYNSGRWAKSINPLILNVIHHHQNPLDSEMTSVFCICRCWLCKSFMMFARMDVGPNPININEIVISWKTWNVNRNWAGSSVVAVKQWLMFCIQSDRLLMCFCDFKASIKCFITLSVLLLMLKTQRKRSEEIRM
jgi:hypothetical protein